MTLFCSISLILALHCLFKHLNLIFTKYLWYSSPFRGTSLDFYLSFITDKVVPHDQQNILAKCFFDIMSCFWPLASFVTSFSPISLIFNLNFKKYLWIVSLFNMTTWKILEKSYTMSYFWPKTSFLTSFCYISLILPLHRLLELLNLIFKKYL